jgi:hypothetical protein
LNENKRRVASGPSASGPKSDVLAGGSNLPLLQERQREPASQPQPWSKNLSMKSWNERGQAMLKRAILTINGSLPQRVVLDPERMAELWRDDGAEVVLNEGKLSVRPNRHTHLVWEFVPGEASFGWLRKGA